MNNFQQYKLHTLDKLTQVVLLNLKGEIVNSCESLFKTTKYGQQPIFSWFPFFETIFEQIKGELAQKDSLKFPKIEQPLVDLKGYYDFILQNSSFNNQKVILWIIKDLTCPYTELFKIQQTRNELQITLQNKNYQNLIVEQEYELTQEKYDMLKMNFEYQQNYYQKLCNTTQSPLSAILGLSQIILNQQISQAHQEHFKALELSSKYLKSILDELTTLLANKPLEHNTFQTQFEIATLLEQVNLRFKYIEHSGNTSLSLNIDENIPTILIGFPDDLKYILISLLINAFKLTLCGKVTTTATLVSHWETACIIKFNINTSSKVSTRLNEEMLQKEANFLDTTNGNIKRLVELRKGQFFFQKDAKEPYNVTFTMTFKLPS